MTADDLNFEKGGGLVTVVAQDATTGAVLMVAHMDREAFDKTVETGEMHYRSRTRGLWHKGATSGNVQHLVSLTPDCDGDAVLARVHPAGPACHTGAESCFGEELSVGDAVSALARTIEGRAAEQDINGDTQGSAGENTQLNPAPPGNGVSQERPSYTKRLLTDRNLRVKKLGEEMAELILAITDHDTRRAAEEGADVVYHVLVALRAAGVTLNDVRAVLAARAAH